MFVYYLKRLLQLLRTISQLHALAYNFANCMRTLDDPASIGIVGCRSQMFAEFGQRYFGQGDDVHGNVLTPAAWEAQRASVHWLQTNKVLRGR